MTYDDKPVSPWFWVAFFALLIVMFTVAKALVESSAATVVD